MKILKVLVGIFILLSFIHSDINAAPVGNPSDTKLPYGDGIVKFKRTIGSVNVSFDADTIFERELEDTGNVTEPQLEGEWYMLSIGYPLFDERFQPYVKIGASHLEVSWKQNGEFVDIKADNDIAWGIGGKFLAYEMPEYNNLRFTLDGQYRFSDPDIDNVTVTDPTRTVSASQFKVHEWQIAGLVSMEFPLSGIGPSGRRYHRKSTVYSLVPYLGLAYSDVDVTGKFTFNNTDYSVGDGGSDTKVTLITGCNLVCPQNFSINAEGRIIGENAVSGGATFKF